MFIRYIAPGRTPRAAALAVVAVLAATPSLLVVPSFALTPSHAAYPGSAGLGAAAAQPSPHDPSGAIDDVTSAGTVVATNTHSQTTLTADGSYRAEITGGPSNYLTEDGAWASIDTTLVEAPGEAFDVKTNANSIVTHLPADASQAPVRVKMPSGHIDMSMRGLDGGPTVEGSQASYNDVESASAVTYTAISTGVKEDIELDVPPAQPVSFTYDLAVSPGIRPVVDEKSIDFYSADNLIATIPEGLMKDSAGNTTTSVDYGLTESASGWLFEVTPSHDWLVNAERTYPVLIDPTLTAAPSTDCFIGDRNRDASHCGDGSAYVSSGRGDNGSVKRGLINFNLLSIPPGADISSATVSLYNDKTQNNNSNMATYGLFNAAKKWGPNATWNNSGLEGAWNGGYSDTTIYSSLSLRGATDGYQTFSGLGPLISDWISGDIRPNGFVLRALDESLDHNLDFFSSAPTTPVGRLPKIAVTYTVPSAPEAACEWTVNGETYTEPDLANMTVEQAEIAIEKEMNTCFVYGIEETCQTDETVYVSQGCPSLSVDPNDRGTGTAVDDGPIDPAIDAKTCIACPGGSGSTLWGGSFSGPAIGVAVGGSVWAALQAFGDVPANVGTRVSNAVEMSDMKETADKNGNKVKWPKKDSATAIKHKSTKYKVYTAYALKSNGVNYFRTWKYGITRQNNSNRLTTAKAGCRSHFGVDKCGGRYLRRNVIGFYNARRIEAGYILRYLVKKGALPPGNKYGM